MTHTVLIRSSNKVIYVTVSQTGQVEEHIIEQSGAVHACFYSKLVLHHFKSTLNQH
jgi:hypothetical protein